MNYIRSVLSFSTMMQVEDESSLEQEILSNHAITFVALNALLASATPRLTLFSKTLTDKNPFSLFNKQVKELYAEAYFYGVDIPINSNLKGIERALAEVENTPKLIAAIKEKVPQAEFRSFETLKAILSDGDKAKLSQEKCLVQDYYRKAVLQRDAEAQCKLGNYFNNGNEVLQDFELSAYWYRKSAEQGYPEAQYNLAICYHYGRGVEEDRKLTAQWCRKAAEQGHMKAQNHLGSSYDHGIGVIQDFKLAALWYEKAAEQGHSMAQDNLGVCYDNGDGVEQNFAVAADWYRRAAIQEYGLAQYHLNTLYRRWKGTASGL